MNIISNQPMIQPKKTVNKLNQPSTKEISFKGSGSDAQDDKKPGMPGFDLSAFLRNLHPSTLNQAAKDETQPPTTLEEISNAVTQLKEDIRAKKGYYAYSSDFKQIQTLAKNLPRENCLEVVDSLAPLIATSSGFGQLAPLLETKAVLLERYHGTENHSSVGDTLLEATVLNSEHSLKSIEKDLSRLKSIYANAVDLSPEEKSVKRDLLDTIFEEGIISTKVIIGHDELYNTKKLEELEAKLKTQSPSQKTFELLDLASDQLHNSSEAKALNKIVTLATKLTKPEQQSVIQKLDDLSDYCEKHYKSSAQKDILAVKISVLQSIQGDKPTSSLAYAMSDHLKDTIGRIWDKEEKQNKVNQVVEAYKKAVDISPEDKEAKLIAINTLFMPENKLPQDRILVAKPDPSAVTAKDLVNKKDLTIEHAKTFADEAIKPTLGDVLDTTYRDLNLQTLETILLALPKADVEKSISLVDDLLQECKTQNAPIEKPKLLTTKFNLVVQKNETKNCAESCQALYNALQADGIHSPEKAQVQELLTMVANSPDMSEKEQNTFIAKAYSTLLPKTFLELVLTKNEQETPFSKYSDLETFELVADALEESLNSSTLLTREKEFLQTGLQLAMTLPPNEMLVASERLQEITTMPSNSLKEDTKDAILKNSMMLAAKAISEQPGLSPEEKEVKQNSYIANVYLKKALHLAKEARNDNNRLISDLNEAIGRMDSLPAKALAPLMESFKAVGEAVKDNVNIAYPVLDEVIRLETKAQGTSFTAEIGDLTVKKAQAIKDYLFAYKKQNYGQTPDGIPKMLLDTVEKALTTYAGSKDISETEKNVRLESLQEQFPAEMAKLLNLPKPGTAQASTTRPINLTELANQKAINAKVDSAMGAFCSQVMEKLSEKALTTEHMIFSPMGPWFLLSLLYNGADGQTKELLTDKLGIDQLKKDGINDQAFNMANKNIADTLIDIAKQTGIKLDSSYSLWGRADDVEWNPEFVDNTSCLEPTIGEFKGKDPSEINKWAADHTNQKIKNLLTERDLENAATVLAHVLYMNGAWQHKFDKERTMPADFNGINGPTLQMMMHQKSDFKYTANQEHGFHMVSLPYAEKDKDYPNQLNMNVILPFENDGLSSVYQYLTEVDKDTGVSKLEDALKTINKKSEKDKINLTMPKFNIEDSHDLKSMLSSMGLESLFDSDQANLSKAINGNMFVDKMMQKAFIDVNEERTEAGAVTYATTMRSLSMGPQPVKFTVDHPFMYTINDNDGRVLFIGTINDLKENEEALTKKKELEE